MLKFAANRKYGPILQSKQFCTLGNNPGNCVLLKYVDFESKIFGNKFWFEFLFCMILNKIEQCGGGGVSWFLGLQHQSKTDKKRREN